MAKKKLPKAQPGREMTDTIGTPNSSDERIRELTRRTQKLLIDGMYKDTFPRDYRPGRLSKPNTTPTNTTPRPYINPNTLEMEPGMSKIGGPVTAMDKVQNLYKSKLTKGGKK
jgi:hypothetical protein